MNAVTQTFIDPRFLNSIVIKREIKDGYGKTILRDELVQQWGLIPEGISWRLPFGWCFLTCSKKEGNYTYYILDKNGNRRARVSFCRYGEKGVLFGLLTVFHRFVIKQSPSGNKFFFILDLKKSSRLKNNASSPCEATLRDWLENHAPDYKNVFAYWDL